MKNQLIMIAQTFLIIFLIPCQESIAQNVPKGFISLFDGKTLKGWNAADMSWWSVEKGAITAEISKEKPCTENQYLFSEYGQMADFELKLKHRLVSKHNVNGGFQFRSEHYEQADCKGYQVDVLTPIKQECYFEFQQINYAVNLFIKIKCLSWFHFSIGVMRPNRPCSLVLL